MPAEITAAAGPALLVAATAAWGRGRSSQCETHGVRCAPCRPNYSGSEHPAAACVGDRPAAMGEHGADAGHRTDEAVERAASESRLAQAMAMVLAQMDVARLLLEGGATASAALRRLKWSRLSAVDLAAVDRRVCGWCEDGPRVSSNRAVMTGPFGLARRRKLISVGRVHPKS